jgi:NAD(P)-dependent dehydrogenase (short-subunit alcohol dehydrogenase family)
MSTTFDFGDQVVLVTGASGSLGTTTVDAFHEGGATVCLTARHRPEKDDIALDSDRLSFYEGDLTDEASAAQVVDNVVTDHGQLDVLVNLIGTWRGSTQIDETDVESFEFLFDVNLKTMFLASKHAIPHLRDSGGSIVSASARASLSGGEGDGPYRAAKAGVRLLTDTLAEENHGEVRANAIMPSIIDTPANREMLPEAAHNVWPTPEEIAQVILFLCSDAAAVTSGAAVPVYGDM